ncbi:DUF6246 family protein [Pantoea sp. App145]|uniref:DUF6246 family protein n=1 Tax=Pantoea sp. App145 TaxID=3071567 RepID=UPI003A812F85
MTPIKEIGEFVLADQVKEYFFRPSFMNMARIGEPEEIVRAFHDLFNDEATTLMHRAIKAYTAGNKVRLPEYVLTYLMSGILTRKAIMAAHLVLSACCDDDISELIGWMKPGRTGRRAFVWRPGAIPLQNIVVLAQGLMLHGIIGKAKIRKLQRHESNDTTPGFRATDYIMAARNHFGISRDEAENLTMTEFILMLNAKYPNQKGFTREEYDAVMDDDDRRWAEMVEREQRT